MIDSDSTNDLISDYVNSCKKLFELEQNQEFLSDFEDQCETSEFVDFVKLTNELMLHMLLSDPPISCSLDCDVDRALAFLNSSTQDKSIVDIYDFRSYSKAEYHCIDGFPQESMPAVVILP